MFRPATAPSFSTDFHWPLPYLDHYLQVSPEGRVLQTLMDPDGSVVSHVSAVTEHGGRLYLGNLAKDDVSVVDVAPQQEPAADAAAAAA